MERQKADLRLTELRGVHLSSHLADLEVFSNGT